MITVKQLFETSCSSSPDGEFWEPCIPNPPLSLKARIFDAISVLTGKSVAIRQTTKQDLCGAEVSRSTATNPKHGTY